MASFDEQIQQLIDVDKRLEERLGALAESVELMLAHSREQDAKFNHMRIAMVQAALVFLQPDIGRDGKQDS